MVKEPKIRTRSQEIGDGRQTTGEGGLPTLCSLSCGSEGRCFKSFRNNHEAAIREYLHPVALPDNI